MSEQMRSDFEALAKPDLVQKIRTGLGMFVGWSAWRAATKKAEADNKEKVAELEETIARLSHDLKNAECAAQLMKHLADRYELNAKRLTEELSLLRAQEVA